VLENYLTPPTLSERRCYDNHYNESLFPSSQNLPLGDDKSEQYPERC
jgi:hypothetical protein